MGAHTNSLCKYFRQGEGEILIIYCNGNTQKNSGALSFCRDGPRFWDTLDAQCTWEYQICLIYKHSKCGVRNCGIVVAAPARACGHVHIPY